MALAFILINTDVAGEQEVMDALKKIPEVDSVHLVYGIYDLIVKVSSDSLDKLKTGVTGSPVSYTHLTLPTTPYV